MSKAKFTQAPWVASVPECSNGFWYVDGKTSISKSGSIAVCYGCNAKNDAHLIATAPEMYNILKDLSEMNSEDAKLFLENSSEIKEILAKARGEI